VLFYPAVLCTGMTEITDMKDITITGITMTVIIMVIETVTNIKKPEFPAFII